MSYAIDRRKPTLWRDGATAGELTRVEEIDRMKILHKIAVTRDPPKAEVEGSNPFGSARLSASFCALPRPSP